MKITQKCQRFLNWSKIQTIKWQKIYIWESICCCSVIQSCSILWPPGTTACQASLFTISQFAQTPCPLSWWCHPTISSCCPLLLLLSIFPSIRVFSNELAPRIRWPKYWSFSFSISPSNDYSGLISFRIDWVWSPGCFQVFLVWCLNFSIWYLKIFSLNVEQYSTIKVWLIDNTEAIINITG